MEELARGRADTWRREEGDGLGTREDASWTWASFRHREPGGQVIDFRLPLLPGEDLFPRGSLPQNKVPVLEIPPRHSLPSPPAQSWSPRDSILSNAVCLTCRNEFKFFQRMTTTSSVEGNGGFLGD